MFLTVVGCLEIKNAAFTNQCGTTDERSKSRDELAQSMPCKEEEDESQITNHIGECGWMILTLNKQSYISA